MRSRLISFRKLLLALGEASRAAEREGGVAAPDGLGTMSEVRAFFSGGREEPLLGLELLRPRPRPSTSSALRRWERAKALKEE